MGKAKNSPINQPVSTVFRLILRKIRLCGIIFCRKTGESEENFLNIHTVSANSFCEVIFMKKSGNLILILGLLFTILISDLSGFIRDGRRLESLRKSVLRLHILADSDDEYAQSLKLKVRDGLLQSGIFESCDTLAEAELTALENLDIIEEKAEEILRENGCKLPVSAELADVEFDERVYGDITMPAGEYRALRVKIGSAQGKNWWCVMYPPLCLPPACEDKDGEKDAAIDAEKVEKSPNAEEFFTEEEQDILHYPEKYEIRFAVWDKIKELIDRYVVQNDENELNP